MPDRFQRITPFLWFDQQAEQAVNQYVSIFENSRIGHTTRYSEQMAAASGQAAGSVMTIAFELDGQSFSAINGGPHFRFSGAISFVVNCASQAEVDHYWSRLSEGGDEQAQQCGWLKDRWGVSWQIVPNELVELLNSPDADKARKAGAAMLKMKKIDLEALRRAVG